MLRGAIDERKENYRIRTGDKRKKKGGLKLGNVAEGVCYRSFDINMEAPGRGSGKR